VDGGGNRLTGSGGIAFRGQASGVSQMTLTTSGLLGIGTGSPTNGDYGSVDPKLHVYDDGSSGSYRLIARFQSGPDADNTGAAVLINHSNDRGLLIEAGRESGDTGIAHFGIVRSAGPSDRVMTLKQGGNVGIGDTSPSEKLEVFGKIRTYSDDTHQITIQSSTNATYCGIRFDDNTTTSGTADGGQPGFIRYTHSDVNTATYTGQSAGASFVMGASPASWALGFSTGQADSNTFGTALGTNKGSIKVESTGTTYNTTSDLRLKENIELITDGRDKILAMKPSTFNFIEDENKTKVHGFIAQEMQDIVPEAVGGDDNSEGMMSMDYGRITPVIVAALQDALKEIDMLKDKIAELEAK